MVGVAGPDHARTAIDGGFCQLNHDKQPLLKRIARDRILYYSPSEAMKGGKPIKVHGDGKIIDDEPSRADQSDRLRPLQEVAFQTDSQALGHGPRILLRIYSPGDA